MRFKHGILLIAAIGILCAGCTSLGGGGESVTPQRDSYPVQIQARMLKFGAVSPSQSPRDVKVDLNVRDNLPELYYRYDITARVNGSYFMMPDPPKVYTVYRVPFYRNTPPGMIVKLTLTNNSQQVIDTSRSICAFDLDGQTLVSQPLDTPELLPGHTLVARVEGPGLDQLQGHDSLVVWVYHLGTQADAAPYKWTLSYQLTEQARSAQAEYVGQSPHEADVARFQGRIDRATDPETSAVKTP
ncbi:MAG TPA: hypothetical protein VFX47_03015 [Gammaproteobacteria bacterium]|nr:hypothetical protein [Gammaproteobacteria bacterium]